MALPSESDELTAAWRALEGAERSAGWRTIHIAVGGSSGASCRATLSR